MPIAAKIAKRSLLLLNIEEYSNKIEFIEKTKSVLENEHEKYETGAGNDSIWQNEATLRKF